MTIAEESTVRRVTDMAFKYVEAEAPDVHAKLQRAEAFFVFLLDTDLRRDREVIAIQAERGHALLFQGMMGFSPAPGLIMLLVFGLEGQKASSEMIAHELALIRDKPKYDA